MPPPTHPLRVSAGLHRRLVALNALGHIPTIRDYVSDATEERLRADGLDEVADSILAASDAATAAATERAAGKPAAEADRAANRPAVSSPERAVERA